MTLDEIEELKPAPKGFQNERGFRVVASPEDEHDPVVLLMVPVVLCRSDRRPDPQYRFCSPDALERGELRVADHLVAKRLPLQQSKDSLIERIFVGSTEEARAVLRVEGAKRGIAAAAPIVRRLVAKGAALAKKLRKLIEAVSS